MLSRIAEALHKKMTVVVTPKDADAPSGRTPILDQ
jgi:hypothetical protein